ncbi:hypothetical protein TGRUB_266360 [Toxoplasma gondii RUB]|uniref:Ribosomal protein L34 n=2 Tax=Toxoplasma gondii TaxID=5811 RepID=A0A086LQA6_TOXGO|nr:hypothetical protein TGRUB_266360 [Toxoplasma gondii RUB]KFH01866.1 hypothetical protein TGVAND_266360 [Toxoplasma gondii VAND]
MRRLPSCLVLGEISLLSTTSGFSGPGARPLTRGVLCTPPIHRRRAPDYSYHFYRACYRETGGQRPGRVLPVGWVTGAEATRIVGRNSESETEALTRRKSAFPRARSLPQPGIWEADSPLDTRRIDSKDSIGFVAPPFLLFFTCSPGSLAHAPQSAMCLQSIPSSTQLPALCSPYQALCGPRVATPADRESVNVFRFPKKGDIRGSLTCCSNQTRSVLYRELSGLASKSASPGSALGSFGNPVTHSLGGFAAQGSRRGFAHRSWQTNKRLRSYKAKRRKRYIRRGETLLRVS